jgi:hypothetical protein
LQDSSLGMIQDLNELRGNYIMCLKYPQLK